MAHFLKQSFAQTCLKETDNGKLQLFNYSRSLITNRGAVERGKIHSARAMKQNTQTWRAASKRGGPGKEMMPMKWYTISLRKLTGMLID